MHNYYSLALRLLDYMGFATEASTECKMGVHTPAPQPWDWGEVPPPTPNLRVFVWDWEGAKECYILRDQTTRDLTFTSPGHTHSPVCAPRPPFLSAELL